MPSTSVRPVNNTCAKSHQSRKLTKDRMMSNLQQPQDSDKGDKVNGRRQEGNIDSRGDDQVGGRHDGVTKDVEDMTKHFKKSQQSVQGKKLDVQRDLQTGSDAVSGLYKTATLKSSLNVSVESDEGPCEITGIVIIQNKPIVCDYSNYKIKVFDHPGHTFLYEHKSEGRPYDIDKLDETTVVVSYRYKMCLKLFTVGSADMVQEESFDTENCCWGVCCYGDKIYCVVREEIRNTISSRIHVYTRNGQLKRRFEYLTDDNIQCNHLQYITVNPQTGILYATDWDTHSVVALTTSGHVIAVMTFGLLKGPQGVAVDEHGQIYVCGMSSNNVIQMSADGQEQTELLSQNIRCKMAQCIKIYGNTMYLGRWESDIISVYELS